MNISGDFPGLKNSTTVPPLRNAPATSVASTSNPPGFPLKSKITPDLSAPLAARADRIERAVPLVNSLIEIKTISFFNFFSCTGLLLNSVLFTEKVSVSSLRLTDKIAVVLG